jgi:predicted hotdog family 3-hydroxylacyl-ACP dehydratase
MLLVGPVLEHRPEFTRCRVAVARSALFARGDGRVPAWVALEWMAQCVAAHGGLVARALGLPVRPGLFLGTRGVSFAADDFGSEEVLEVCARHLRGELGLVSFACRLERPGEGAALAEGSLSVFVVERIEELLARTGDPA